MPGDQLDIGTQYGAKVLGEEEARRSAAISELTSNNTYGSKVIGEDRAARLRKIVERQPEPEPEHQLPVSAPATIGDALGADLETYTVEDIKAILAEQPSALERIVTLELTRVEGPRREALEAIIDAAIVAEWPESKTQPLFELLEHC